MNDIKSMKSAATALDECRIDKQSDTLLFENRIEMMIALNHNVFNEKEAAFFCRCSVDSIRYHALRSRKLTFCDFTKEGLVFLKTDLEAFLKNSRKRSYRG